MKVAVLNDIHGHLPALEAVLGDLKHEQVDTVVIGGDVALGPMPAQTLDAIHALPYRTVLLSGNCERELLKARLGDQPESGDGGDLWTDLRTWAASELEDRHLEFLETFNAKFSARIGPLGCVLFCHGSPRSDEEILTAITPEERIRTICADVAEDVIVCGHTHHQFDRTLAGKRIVNAGSVGLAYEGEPGIACWAMLGPEVELRRSRFDQVVARRRFEQAGFPRAGEFADELDAPPTSEEVAEHFEQVAQQQA
jgi:putative phosphoesterase